jgi:hypothetical protein
MSMTPTPLVMPTREHCVALPASIEGAHLTMIFRGAVHATLQRHIGLRYSYQPLEKFLGGQLAHQ